MAMNEMTDVFLYWKCCTQIIFRRKQVIYDCWINHCYDTPYTCHPPTASVEAYLQLPRTRSNWLWLVINPVWMIHLILEVNHPLLFFGITCDCQKQDQTGYDWFIIRFEWYTSYLKSPEPLLRLKLTCNCQEQAQTCYDWLIIKFEWYTSYLKSPIHCSVWTLPATAKNKIKRVITGWSCS